MRWQALLLLVGLQAAYCLQWHVEVTVNVFSGDEDPRWLLTADEASSMVKQFEHDLNTLPSSEDAERPLPWYRLGYRGFVLKFRHSQDGNHWESEERAVYNTEALESFLLNTASVNSRAPAGVIDHVVAEIQRLANDKAAGVSYSTRQTQPRVHLEDCTLPVLGPDNSTVYDPTNDDCGYFETYIDDNNCYNYGNDIVTNTFAQPGRGSGQKWSQNTCDDMKAAAIRDGLFWNGTTLPVGEPNRGHYVALLIWPDTNFHWIRKDSSPLPYWSHKPGGTEVRNVDDDGNLITDPSKSDFSPWTQFCGYMTTIPSVVTIK